MLVADDSGSRHLHLRPSVPPLAVGDWVTSRDSSIGHLLDRVSLLQRKDPGTELGQPIAANIDIVGIVCGLDRPLSIGRIERFSTIAWDSGATPLVVLSKGDLVNNAREIEDEILRSIPGSEVMTVSSTEDSGVDELRRAGEGKTLVLVGESGAGKSTLLNAMAGEHAAATGAVRDGDHKGRHTTTARELHLLDGNCCLIDTPGVREVGIFTDVGTVDDGFSEIADLADTCKFNDCQHESEPGCAVLAAIDDGSLGDERVASWRALRREAASAELRSDRAAYRAASRKQGKMYRGVLDIKRQGHRP